VISEQDNLQKVRRGYKAFAEGDLAPLLSLVTNDVEFLPPVIASVPFTHPWRGTKK
jgi:ketosteroid isomerase-like protein